MLVIGFVFLFIQCNALHHTLTDLTNLAKGGGDDSGDCDQQLATCCKYFSLWNMRPFVSWGSTPENEKKWYRDNDCDSVMGGKYSPRCPYSCPVHGCKDCSYFKLVTAQNEVELQNDDLCLNPNLDFKGTCNRCNGACSGSYYRYDPTVRPRCDRCPPQCEQNRKCDQCAGGKCSQTYVCSSSYFETTETCKSSTVDDCLYCQNGVQCDGGKCVCGASYVGDFCQNPAPQFHCVASGSYADFSGSLARHCKPKSWNDCNYPCERMGHAESELAQNAKLRKTNAALLQALETLTAN